MDSIKTRDRNPRRRCFRRYSSPWSNIWAGVGNVPAPSRLTNDDTIRLVDAQVAWIVHTVLTKSS